jgi:glyoxylase-like metal-dependent hydrolase (beta-lactamase superfamily II)
MKVQELAPGLWRWTGLHPEWTPDDGGPNGWEQEVGCVYVEAGDRVVLIDPLVPPEDPDRFWEALDRDVEGKRVRILLTCDWHGRSAKEIEQRYDAEIGGEPPRGLVPIEVPPIDERLWWIPEHGALVAGDVLLGDEDAGVRLCPDSWFQGRSDPAAIRGILGVLLDLPVERLLVSHGEPVLKNTREALARALSP